MMRIEYPDPRHPDMSPEAILARLQMVETLRRLGLSLKEAGDKARAEKAALADRKIDECPNS